VDGIGQLVSRPRVQGGMDEGIWRFAMPTALAPMTAPKGSIAVDGISLTVVDCGNDWFTVALIPETVTRTAMTGLRPGDSVNLEADPIGRFVVRALALRGSDEKLARFAQGGWDG
jgi:riboflavin synthase